MVIMHKWSLLLILLAAIFCIFCAYNSDFKCKLNINRRPFYLKSHGILTEPCRSQQKKIHHGFYLVFLLSPSSKICLPFLREGTKSFSEERGHKGLLTGYGTFSSFTFLPATTLALSSFNHLVSRSWYSGNYDLKCVKWEVTFQGRSLFFFLISHGNFSSTNTHQKILL